MTTNPLAKPVLLRFIQAARGSTPRGFRPGDEIWSTPESPLFGYVASGVAELVDPNPIEVAESIWSEWLEVMETEDMHAIDAIDARLLDALEQLDKARPATWICRETIQSMRFCRLDRARDRAAAAAEQVKVEAALAGLDRSTPAAAAVADLLAATLSRAQR